MSPRAAADHRQSPTTTRRSREGGKARSVRNTPHLDVTPAISGPSTEPHSAGTTQTNSGCKVKAEKPFVKKVKEISGMPVVLGVTLGSTIKGVAYVPPLPMGTFIPTWSALLNWLIQFAFCAAASIGFFWWLQRRN
ncbi:hypothetical protein HOY82DRAFT_596488 [Tuber indicum]|nr:hypothetical protein HOY82DRAFT_596488 [Tuber indicum]